MKILKPIPIEQRILIFREQKVMLDADLADLYGVTTKALNQAVKRNRERFPVDFIFQLTPEEKQEVVTNCDHLQKLRFSPVLPYAFTEHGALMLASALKSRRAIRMSIFVVRAFVQIKILLARRSEAGVRLDDLEHRVGEHDFRIAHLIHAVKQLTPPKVRPPRHKIGF